MLSIALMLSLYFTFQCYQFEENIFFASLHSGNFNLLNIITTCVIGLKLKLKIVVFFLLHYHPLRIIFCEVNSHTQMSSRVFRRMS
jgi:hypothetical protein